MGSLMKPLEPPVNIFSSLKSAEVPSRPEESGALRFPLGGVNK
jgi:hypothetical protein